MRGSGRPTIRAVADKAGVSVATVSRVMAGLTVRPESAQRVRAAADALGYRPSSAAQGLASGRRRSVGVVAPDLANPFFSGMLKAFNACAVSAGTKTLVADTSNNPEEEIEVSRSLLRHVDALVLASPRMAADSLRLLANESRNIVLINRVALGVGLPTVTVDFFGAMLELCGHLARLGHRKLAYLAGPPAAWPSIERRRAIEHAAAFGLEIAVIEAGASIECGHAAVVEALTHEPTALVAFNDLVAFGALAKLSELGIQVPDEVSLTGADDIPFARFGNPPLTTTLGPHQQLGEAAWELVTAVIAGDIGQQIPPLKADMVERESTGPAPMVHKHRS